MSNRVLAVGGAGYVGSHCVKHLAASGDDVFVYDNLSSGHREALNSMPLVVGDLTDTALLDETFRRFRPDAVMHFAASVSPSESMDNPLKYYRNNVVTTIALLETMKRHGVRRLVFSSSCAVYGEPSDFPVVESMPPAPVSPYGRTKLMMEQAMADCASAWGLGFVALRYFNAAGAAPDGSIGEDHDPEIHLIPVVIAAAMGQRKHVQIFGTDYPTADGSCVRDFVHVEDLASAHRLALERTSEGRGLYYNLGTGRGTSVREVIEAVQEVSGANVDVIESPRRAGDPPAVYADPSLAERELGWQAQATDICDIAASAWRWHTRHPNGYAT